MIQKSEHLVTNQENITKMKTFINSFKKLDTEGKYQWVGIYISVFGMILHGIFGLDISATIVISVGLITMISSFFVK